MTSLLNRIKLRQLYKILKVINDYQDKMKRLSDDELKRQTKMFISRYNNGESLDDFLPEAFATIREASRRVLGMFAYDEQVLAGIALHKGKIVEMKTGEGKTLVATMPLYLNAITGKGVILITSNGYLARRDALEMGQVYKWLGLTVGIGVPEDIQEELSLEEKKKVYSSDIIYTTHAALTFDYLLENLCVNQNDKCMRDFYYVVIDEVDSVLLDAANMPLVISGAPRVQSNLYKSTDYFVGTLEKEDYEKDDKQIWLTSKGIHKAEEFFGVNNLYTKEYYGVLRHINLALKAHFIFNKDEQYVVQNDKIMLLDKSSGRMVENTKLKSGLHQAIEVKEGLNPSSETRAMASITYQAFFNMFKKKSGMSGSVIEEKKELKFVYNIDVVEIPTHRPILRKDLKDSYYGSFDEQFEASMEWLMRAHKKNQPVLVVTSSIEMSYIYSQVLLKNHIAHNVLNAYNVAKEAEIIKDAGQLGAVTIATAIAGRGTDIKLSKEVKQLGGLLVLGIGRMENKRLEKQARGRSGRQGDPGTSKFFVSLDDEVIKEYGAPSLMKYQHEKEIKSRRIKRLMNQAQKNFEIAAYRARNNTLEFDSSTSAQRYIIYTLRNRILKDEINYDEMLDGFIQDQIKDFLIEIRTKEEIERFILNNIQYHIDTSLSYDKNQEKLLLRIAREQLSKRKSEMSQNRYKQFLRVAILNAIDNAWIEQVDYLEQLRASIGLRRYSQKNVIFEYHQEAYRAFEKMLDNAKRNAIRNVMLSSIIEKAEGTFTVMLP
jgi:preprotein translocase subunit SecA